MIQQIIDDAKAMETEAIQNEKDAEVAYETFVKETTGKLSWPIHVVDHCHLVLRDGVPLDVCGCAGTDKLT